MMLDQTLHFEVIGNTANEIDLRARTIAENYFNAKAELEIEVTRNRYASQVAQGLGEYKGVVKARKAR